VSRAEFPARVKVKRLAFAEFKCEGEITRDDGSKTRCNAPLANGRVEFDHHNADGLTGKPTFENCRALCRACHKEKTKLDVAAISKAKRREAAHLNARPAPTQKIPNRGFAPSTKAIERQKREPRASLPPRPMFMDEK
jgi:hypothetical protein